MSVKTKRLLKKFVNWLGLFFFAFAVYMIYRQMSKYSLLEIKQAIWEIPDTNLLYAALASLFGYFALSSYDFLSLKYIKHHLPAWKWMFAGSIGFAVSNNAGHAIVSGGAIRYRLYTRWRFKPEEIVKMVTFSGFTYLVACFFLLILGYVLTPSHALGGGTVSKLTTEVVTLLSVIGLAFYFWASLFYKKPFCIKDLEFYMPNFKMALAQVFIGGIDIVLASLVLYFALIPFVQIDFDVFLGVFLVAQILGIYSQVPGGLGVFEGLFLYILPSSANPIYLFGALIAYRIIYYVLPLIVAGIAMFSYETSLRIKRQKAANMRQENC